MTMTTDIMHVAAVTTFRFVGPNTHILTLKFQRWFAVRMFANVCLHPIIWSRWCTHACTQVLAVQTIVHEARFGQIVASISSGKLQRHVSSMNVQADGHGYKRLGCTISCVPGFWHLQGVLTRGIDCASMLSYCLPNCNSM